MSYEGGGAPALNAVRAHVDEAVRLYKVRLEAEPLLLDVLESRGSPAAAKQFAATQLMRICDEDTLPRLRPLLRRSDTVRLASELLQGIADPDAREALINGLEKAPSTDGLIAMIQALGERGETEAVGTLRNFGTSSNENVATAAMEALGKIGGFEAATALGWARANVRRSLKARATTAYLHCGWTSLEQGDREAALEVFDTLFVPIEPMDVQTEALRGLIRTEGAASVPRIIEVLEGPDTALHGVAAEEAARIPGVEMTSALVSAYADLTAANKVVVLHTLGERGDPGAVGTLIQATIHRDPAVRLAALRALSNYSDPEALVVLLRASGAGSPQEREVARDNLARLEGEGVDDELVRAAMNADNIVRAAAIRAMTDRGTTSGIPVLLRIAERDVEGIRFEALNALGELAGPEHLDALLQLLADGWSPEAIAAIERTLINVLDRAAPGPGRVEPLARALNKGGYGTPVRAALVRLLGSLQDDAAVEALASAARDREPQVRSRAVAYLADWQSPAALEELERLAKGARDDNERAMLTLGYIRLLDENVGGNAEEDARWVLRAAKLAETTEEYLRLIAAMAKVPHEDVARQLDRYAKQEELRSAAESAKATIGF
jgi:HEAT repeat protein